MQNHSYENDFDLRENETACRTHEGRANRGLLVLSRVRVFGIGPHTPTRFFLGVLPPGRYLPSGTVQSKTESVIRVA